MKKAGKLFVLGMIAMGVLSACGTKDEPNGAASKDVETSVRTAAPSYTPAKETPLTQVAEHPVQTDTKECVLSVKNWDDPKDGLDINFTRFGDGGASIDASMYHQEGLIAYEENFKNVVDKNSKQYYTGEIKYTDYEKKSHTAARYVKNDNSYVIYETKYKRKKHHYIAVLNQVFQMDDPEGTQRIDFPFICCDDIGRGDVLSAWLHNEDSWQEKIFGRYDYKQLKEFYTAFSEKTVSCDDQTETIRVAGRFYNEQNEPQQKGTVILDLKNKKVTVERDDNTKVWDHTDYLKSLKKNYVSAGKYKGREFFYDEGSALIFSEKNGKMTLAIEDQDEQGFYLEDTGWNCVGEYVEMKVSKKSNSKNIYLDVIVHLLEDGSKSEIKRTVVLEGNGRYIKCRK